MDEELELAKDMIKLLGQELKHLRAQLSDANQRSLAHSESSISTSSHVDCTRALEAKNARVKELESQLDQSRHALGDGGNISHLEKILEQTKSQFEELSEEKIRIEAEKDAKISRLQDKYKSNGEKYKAQKSANVNMQQEFEVKLEELRRERGLEDDHTPPDRIDPKAFLASSPNRLYPQGIRVCTKQPSIDLSERMKKLFLEVAPETLHYSDQELLWSEDGISRVIAILPFRRYNPKARNNIGSWQHGSKPTVGKECNLFYRSEEGWSYMGAFRCVQSGPLESEQFSFVASHVKQYTCQRTILFPNLVPRFLSDMVEEMYSQGALRAECFAFEFQHFDEALNRQLLVDCGTPESSNARSKRSVDGHASLKTRSKRQRTL